MGSQRRSNEAERRQEHAKALLTESLEHQLDRLQSALEDLSALALPNEPSLRERSRDDLRAVVDRLERPAFGPDDLEFAIRLTNQVAARLELMLRLGDDVEQSNDGIRLREIDRTG